MGDYPGFTETSDTVVIVSVKEMGSALVKEATAYLTDWVELVYIDGTVAWYRADMIEWIAVKDRAQHEEEVAKAEEATHTQEQNDNG